MHDDAQRIELGWFARHAIRFFAPPEIAESFAGDLLEEARARIDRGENERSVERWTRLQIARAVPGFARQRIESGGVARGRVRIGCAVILVAWRVVFAMSSPKSFDIESPLLAWGVLYQAMNVGELLFVSRVSIPRGRWTCRWIIYLLSCGLCVVLLWHTPVFLALFAPVDFYVAWHAINFDAPEVEVPGTNGFLLTRWRREQLQRLRSRWNRPGAA